MDSLASSPLAGKSRRHYAHEFKTMVIKACNEPGNSSVSVAQKFQLNANLIHMWSRRFEQ